MLYLTILTLLHLCLMQSVAGHASIWHPSMLGFNVTAETFPYDNRPVSPLTDMTFDQWWFHGHLAYPPHPEDVFELPAGSNVTTQIGCNKGATDFFASSEGGDIRNGNDPCPGSPTSEYHTTGIDDVKGCALAIAYKDDFNATRPEDFTVFSVNQTCVWSRFTEFSVPARMPPCPNGKCICAWFWIHSQDSGGEQNYMNGFQCNITNSVSDVALAKPEVPRRCGADPDFGKQLPAPGNCTYGAKQPFYWFQAERNNMNEGTYAPPFYLDLYGFLDGPQDDIFQDSYANIPEPSDNQTALPILKTVVPGQRLAVPDLHLLPSNFLASALASVPSPTMFVASTAPAAPMTTSSAQSTIATSSIQSASVTSSLSSSASTSMAQASTTSAASSPTSALSAATVTVTNVVTVVVAVEPEPTAAPISSGSNTTNAAVDVTLASSSNLLAANDTTDPGALNPATRPKSCTHGPNLLEAQQTPSKRSLAERLGMGTYTKRDVRSRSLWSFW